MRIPFRRRWPLRCALLAAAAVVLAAGGPRVADAADPRPPDLARVRVLAIAPWADEAPLSGPLAAWGANRLSEMAARAPFQVVGAARVAEAMRRLGLVPADLISPTRTVTLGREVGADAVLSGRVTLVQQERERDEPGPPSPGALNSRVDVDVRILEVATRLVLFQETFICQVPGVAVAAMDCVVHAVAARVIPRRV